MMAFSALTMQHFFAANYPTSIFEGSFCDINAFFNCDSSASSVISAVAGVPIGWFGLMLGGLVSLGAVLPSMALERTNRTLAALNVAGVVTLLLYSVVVLGSLCLLCSGYYVFSFVAFLAYWKGAQLEEPLSRQPMPWASPSLVHLALFGVVTLGGAWGVAEYHEARRVGQSGGIASRVVSQFYSLPSVAWPSEISTFWTVRSTEDFEAAPIRVVEYGDPLCIDCRLLWEQLDQLKEEFAGKINIAYQFFPLEAACNDVVDKDKHPGACELSYMLAADEEHFSERLDEVYENMRAAEEPAWRADFAARHGVADAPDDEAIRELVHRHMQTGAEYEKTHDEFAHGIRSTPTMIINNRMVIGTLPYEQLRAIFQALVDEHERGGDRFMESWVES
jgi:predicted DsbA family dithiol-disulfide isomerase/uncharacterized membrane protein